MIGRRAHIAGLFLLVLIACCVAYPRPGRTAPDLAADSSVAAGTGATENAYQSSLPDGSDVNELVGQLGRMLLALLGVLALVLFFFKWGLPRIVGMPRQRSRYMEVVDQMSLEASKRLYIVKIGDQHRILGSTEMGLQTLGRINDAELTRLTSHQEDGSLPRNTGRLRACSLKAWVDKLKKGWQ